MMREISKSHVVPVIAKGIRMRKKKYTAKYSFGRLEIAYFFALIVSSNKQVWRKFEWILVSNKNRKKNTKLFRIEWRIQCAMLEACVSELSHVLFSHPERKKKITQKTSSNNWHSHGWNGKNWVVAIHRIGHKVKNTLSFVRLRCTPTQLWIS